MKRLTCRVSTRFLLALCLFFCFPSVTYANVIITPLFKGVILHLFIGNMLIGILEGCLLFLLAHTPKVASILLMILTNYVSSWLGLYISGICKYQIPGTIENIQFWFWMFILVTFLLTVVIEFPFLFLILRKREHKLRKSIIITFAINAISYILICGWYLNFSEISGITDLSVVPVNEMRVPEGYVLYFVAPDGKSVLRSDMMGKNVEKVKTIETQGEAGWLFSRPNQESTDQLYDLFLYVHCYDFEDPWRPACDKEELIAECFSASCIASFDPFAKYEIQSSSVEKHADFVAIPQLNTSSKWQYYPVVNNPLGASNGIGGKNIQDGSEFRFSFETLFHTWAIRQETHIAGDFVVFQLDEDQICILHPQTKKIALITCGKSPVVAEATVH